MNSALKLSVFALLTLVLAGCCCSTPPAASATHEAPATPVTPATPVAAETKLPDWIPTSADFKPEVLNTKKTDKGEEVILFYKTAKSPADVAAFYAAGFEKAGFDKTKFVADHISEDGNAQENLKTDDGKRAWFLSARLDKGAKETTVSLVYQIKG